MEGSEPGPGPEAAPGWLRVLVRRAGWQEGFRGTSGLLVLQGLPGPAWGVLMSGAGLGMSQYELALPGADGGHGQHPSRDPPGAGTSAEDCLLVQSVAGPGAKPGPPPPDRAVTVPRTRNSGRTNRSPSWCSPHCSRKSLATSELLRSHRPAAPVTPLPLSPRCPRCPVPPTASTRCPQGLACVPLGGQCCCSRQGLG